MMFNNPHYIIPEDDLALFDKFLRGGSRYYPSDGNIPVDVVAHEARLVLEKLKAIAQDQTHELHTTALQTLECEELSLIRGTMKLYLGDYTTRDWRRKRSTDDIDFWIQNKNLLEACLRELNYFKNIKTHEWEKYVRWKNPWTGMEENGLVIASDDYNQTLDFGAGSNLEGSSLKDEFKKKLKRGHDVDLSDIINVAIVNNKLDGSKLNPEWINAWQAFEESANTRHPLTLSNLISMCRLSVGIANYLKRVGESIGKYKQLFLNPHMYSDPEIINICRISSHILEEEIIRQPIITRQRIYDNLVRQERIKLQYSKNLKDFANKLLVLVNSKYSHLKVIFEIEGLFNPFGEVTKI